MSRPNYKFKDLVDIPALSEMLDKLYEISHIPSAIIDIEGNVLTGAGWQRICLDFHRKNPEAEKICIKSDTYIRGEIEAGKPYVIYECPHGLVDSCCPIMIEGQHIANVFTGQMLHAPLNDETIDRFRLQARQYGFNENDYLDALSEVPVFPIEKHKSILDFLSQLASQIAQMGLNNLRILKQKNSIQESEELYRSLFQTNHSIMLIIDPATGDIVDANPTACIFYGYSRDKITRKKINDINLLSKDQVQQEMERAKEEKRQNFYFQHRLATGEIKDVEVYSGPITRHGKKLLYSIIHDITDRKQKEEQLRKSKEEWERTFNAINDIVCLQDTSMKIVKVNKIGCDILDLPCENITGRYCYELFHGSSEPCPECPLLETKKSFKPYAKEMTHEKLGKTFLVSAAPVLDDQGNLTHIVHVAKDITEKKKIEERLFRNEKLATIAGLAAGVAHEINTPLSAILQSQQMIEMRLDSDKQRNQERAAECGVDLAKVEIYFKNNELDVFMKGMKDSAITAGNIIKNLLEFSRPHMGEIRNVNLPMLLDASLELARSDYDLKKRYDIINVEIVKGYDPDVTEVPCVAMEVEQVILNLIKNAVHAMASDDTEAPCIIIRTAKIEKMARIEVEDNGPGIGKETQLHIFDPFFTTKEVGRGTGLGLSVSHALIVDKHRGNIWVESEPGKGAKFIIELPLSQEV